MGEVVTDNLLNEEGYYRLYERRLLPVFDYINETATQELPALVTVPGIGCGQFSGVFIGTISRVFKNMLRRLITDYGARWPNIAALYFDPYQELEYDCEYIQGITFITQAFTRAGALARAQLSHPASFVQNFSYCQLFSLVAWDPVSWPGNDFYLCLRQTDDGVKAAATDAMRVFTGVEGEYCPKSYKYLPPKDYENWLEVVKISNLILWQ